MSKDARRRLRALAFCSVLVVCVGCDHAAKGVATGLLAAGERVSLLGDAVRFELAHNPGAFMSAGAALPEGVRSLLFLGLMPLVIAVVCVLAVRAGLASGAALLALGLVAGGGAGNWLDRLVNDGRVTDFVSVGVGPLRTGIFNLADVFILAGIGLLLVFARGRPRDAAPPVCPSPHTAEGASR
jgi:signal peptidase II